MTVVLGKDSALGSAGWSQMPGWGIVADLTPPELRARRALAVLRRWIAGALVLVVLLCVGGYFAATRSADRAQAALDTAQTQTISLNAQVAAHSTVTQVQSATSTIDSQLSQLFGGDVDVPNLVASLIEAMPAGMTLTSVNLTLTPAAATTAGTTASIGNVSLAGTADNLVDLTSYVTTLNTVSGVTQVVPSTNSTSGHGASWTLVLQVTSKRYAHRFGAN